MSRRFTAAAVATATTAALALTVPAGSVAAAPAGTTRYTVVAEDGVSAESAVAAIRAAGGTVVSRTDDVGVFEVTSDRTDFAKRATAAGELIGASEQRAIGYAPKLKRDAVERENLTQRARAAGKGGATGGQHGPKADPLDDKLWGQRMIRADRAHAAEPGDRGVTVGVLDTGLDASNPDLAPHFSRSLSRNFAPDKTDVDGPCEVASCLDPVGTDDGGHGTHVAGIIGAAANGVGLTGVAPDVTLVELKGGQDSGYFFVNPVVNALVYAGKAGLDVVNMSFYVDPWLFNCANNPADSPEAQAEQRAIIKAMNRALNFAYAHGVTLVAAMGNENDDLGSPRNDVTSPDYGGTPYERPIDNKTCLNLPTEGPHVIAVSSLGPSGKKSDFSNYGTEQTEVAAPGGWFRDGFGTPSFRTNANMILSSYPKKVLQEEGTVDADGNVVPGNEDLVYKDCPAQGECGYYTYLQGTSMASPHAAGVAALIVSKFGRRDHRTGGLTLAPDLVENQLYRTAAEHACPTPRLQQYRDEGRDETFDAYCAGGTNFNGFYGYGIVDAYAAVTTPLHPGARP
ncbi:S8 family serine peptidase [Micromonospora sp. NPDC049559]|uniref:S8 family serine peptidase n=1 Tax=Micromonospora sp. NPDC049559 TaxID=3155923 RepID=UPI00343D62C2